MPNPSSHAQSSDASSGVNGSNSPDYSAVDLPQKPPTEYSYVERRAELLQQVRDLGTPDAINQSEQAERYGVSQQQISRDMDRLGEHIREAVADRDRRALTIDSVVRRSIQGLLDDGEYRAAASTALDYSDWLTEFHDLDELEERLATLEREADVDLDASGGSW